MSVADLYDGSQIRHEYSAALVHARIELLGDGDRERALRMLAELEKLLDTFENNGGKHYGLFALRAELYALRGEKERARKAMKPRGSMDGAHAGAPSTIRSSRESPSRATPPNERTQ